MLSLVPLLYIVLHIFDKKPYLFLSTLSQFQIRGFFTEMSGRSIDQEAEIVRDRPRDTMSAPRSDPKTSAVSP